MPCVGICLKNVTPVNQHLDSYFTQEELRPKEWGIQCTVISVRSDICFFRIHQQETHEQRGWTRWPPEIPSNLIYSVILWNVTKTSEADDRPGGPVCKCLSHWTVLLHPYLNPLTTEVWSSELPDMRMKGRKKMAKGRCVLFSLKRNFSSDRQPLHWCSRYVNVGFCYTQSKSSFKQDMSTLPKQEQSQMLSKKLHCDPM